MRTEKQLTKHPEEFGHGAIEGVAGPEAANNAAAAGTLVPLADAGPADHGHGGDHAGGVPAVRPATGAACCSPRTPQLVWGLIASLLIANVMLLVLNLPLIGLWVKLLSIPRPWLYAGILLFATLGTIGVNPSPVELAMLLIFRRHGLSGCGFTAIRSRRSWWG